MPNRLVSVNYNDHNCYIHLYFDENKMDINVLDQQLREELRVSTFSINTRGELITNEATSTMNTIAVKKFYTVVLQQQKDAINSFSVLD